MEGKMKQIIVAAAALAALSGCASQPMKASGLACKGAALQQLPDTVILPGGPVPNAVIYTCPTNATPLEMPTSR
jgi:hypothetical protein